MPSREGTPPSRARTPLGSARLLKTGKPDEQRNRFGLRKQALRVKPKSSEDHGWHQSLRFEVGEDWTGPENPLFQGRELSGDDSVPVARQLMEALAENMTRVVELFKSWDDNLDGRITKKEFRKAMKVLMKKVDTPIVDSLFETFDQDRGGYIEFKELTAALRKARTDVEERREKGEEVGGDTIAAWMSSSKDLLPGQPWRGPLLSKKATVFVLGPPVQQTNQLCKKLAENFDGKCITTAVLADREIKFNTALGAEVKKARAEGAGLPTPLVVAMLQSLIAMGTGPFFLQGIPRTLEELDYMEARLPQCRCAIEIVVPGAGELSIVKGMVQEFSNRENLVTVHAHADQMATFKQVESHLAALKQEEYLLSREERRVAASATEKMRKDKREKLMAGTLAMSNSRKKVAREEAQQLIAHQQQQAERHQRSLEERLSRLQTIVSLEHAHRAAYGGSFAPFVVPMQSGEVRRLQQQWSLGSIEQGPQLSSPKAAYSGRMRDPTKTNGLRGSSSMPRLGSTAKQPLPAITSAAPPAAPAAPAPTAAAPAADAPTAAAAPADAAPADAAPAADDAPAAE